MKKRKTIDLVLLLLWPIIATILALLLQVNAFVSIILFLIAPSVYLSFRAPEHIKKSLFFSLVVGIPMMIMIDYIAHKTQAWLIPRSVLSFRLLGQVSIEVLLWAVFSMYFAIMFYEYFLDKHITHKLWHPRMKYLLAIVLALCLLFFTVFFSWPSALNIPYFYLFFGVILFFIPVLLQLTTRPSLLPKFFKTAAYFFYLAFLYEITGLKLRLWSFPGTQFIGWVNMFGVTFPLEEILFWFILLALATLSYYEFFDDYKK